MLSKVIADSAENSMIVDCSIGMGLAVTVVPERFERFPSSIQILTSNGIVAGSTTSIIMNIIFNIIPSKTKDKENEDSATPTKEMVVQPSVSDRKSTRLNS